MCCLYIRDKCIYQAKHRGILLSAVLVHSSMPEAHIAMCNNLNKVHSYLAHPSFAPVQVGMRPSGDFFRQYSPSLYRLLLLKPPEYSLLFVYSLNYAVLLFMLLLICSHYLDFSRAGLCMLRIDFSLAAAMCTQGSSAWHE